MVKLGNLAAFFVITLTILSIVLVNPGCAQVGVTNPSTPSFGVNYEIVPIDIPPVYGVDQSTGKAVVTKAGYTAYDETVFITILNQPFVPYKDSDDNNIQLFYSMRWKAPRNNSWVEPVNTTQSNEERTICTFDFMGNYHKELEGLDIPLGSETDFQVEASIGYYTTDNVFVGKSSGWTNPQAIQHAANYSASPSGSSAIPNSSVLFGLDWVGVVVIALLAVVVALLLVVVVVYLRRKSVW